MPDPQIERYGHKPGRGQAMVEYAVVAALVLLVAVVGLAALGTGLQTGFMGMVAPPPAKSGVPIATNTAPSAAVANVPAAAVQAASGTGNRALVSPNTLQVKLADGSTMNLNIPQDAAKSVVTVGANGTTELLASSLEALAAQLKAEGKIDQTGSDAVMKLANLAHRTADVEKVVEAAMVQSGGNTQAALNSSVVFEGKTYAKLSDLTALIETGSQLPDGSYNFGPQTQEFYDAFSALWPAGVMNDPKVAGIIDVYTHEIANLADGNRVVLDQMADNYGTPDAFRSQLASYMSSIGYNDTAQKLSEKTGSAVTHVDSATICTTGGDTDAGTKCTR